MFGWWKKNDGFEWREYVRTTILVRRQRRREKVVEALDAAVAGAKDAGRAGLSAGRWGLAAFARGAVGLARAAGRNLKIGTGYLGRGLLRSGDRAWPALAGLGRNLQHFAQPFAVRIDSRGLRLRTLIVAVACLLAGTARAITAGLDQGATIALAIAATAFALLALLWLLTRTGGSQRFSPGPRAHALRRGLAAAWTRYVPAGYVPARPGLLAAGIGIAGGVAVLGWAGAALLSSGPGLVGAAPAGLPLFASTQEVSGRATALSGDTLRIGEDVVRLTGIEAPGAGQRCPWRGNKSWRCGAAARLALAKLVRRRSITCEVADTNAASVRLGTCQVDDKDLGAELVKDGNVFAEQGLLAPYKDLEQQARSARIGIWRGDPQRPQEWRAKVWEEAKRAAPEGCPIKGQIRSNAKIYVLPWQRSYDRVRPSRARGERWFCSEKEAVAAGWRSLPDHS